MLTLWVALLSMPVTEVPPRFLCLAETYPGIVNGVVKASDGRLWVQLAGERPLLWDDGIDPKSAAQRLAVPDLEDTLSTPYPVGRQSSAPAPGNDPGRIRVDAWLRALYGTDPRSVEAALETVEWMPRHGGKRLRFNGRNGAAAALRRVSADLDRLPTRFHRYVTVTAGTFNWRRIKGTTRLSAHAFAIAIDINVEFTDYWRWAKRPGKPLAYRNRIPYEVVEIFERHGFIWGGKWHHFDTMHFEYRPELLHPNCAVQDTVHVR